MKTDSKRLLRIKIGRFDLCNPVVCGSGEPVMTEAGINAALRAGAAGVIAKSINEREAAARQLDHADYTVLDASGLYALGMRYRAPRASAAAALGIKEP